MRPSGEIANEDGRAEGGVEISARISGTSIKGRRVNATADAIPTSTRAKSQPALSRHALNALPQLAAANVNCRILPDDTEDYVTETLKRVVNDEQVSVTVVGVRRNGPPSPINENVMSAVSTITDRLWPGVAAVPMMVMGATDGLYLREVGIPTYGVQGIFYDRDDIRFHGRDERVNVQSFYEAQTFLYELVKRLSVSK